MDFEYDHDTFWPALNELCRRRRAERLRRWEAGGKIIGESEIFMQGGTDESVQGIRYEGEKLGWDQGMDEITSLLQGAKLAEPEKQETAAAEAGSLKAEEAASAPVKA